MCHCLWRSTDHNHDLPVFQASVQAMVSSHDYVDHGTTKQVALLQEIRPTRGHGQRDLLHLLDPSSRCLRLLFIQQAAALLSRAHDQHRLGHSQFCYKSCVIQLAE